MIKSHAYLAYTDFAYSSSAIKILCVIKSHAYLAYTDFAYSSSAIKILCVIIIVTS